MAHDHEIRQLQHHVAHLTRMMHQRGDKQHFGSLTDQNLSRGTQYDADWFVYLFAIGSLAAAATSIINLITQADAPFELDQISLQGNKNGAAEPWPDNVLFPVTLFITDTGTGRNLMNAPVPANLITGQGKLPFILPQSRIFKEKATITLTTVNFGGSTYDNLNLAFIGKKLFGMPKQ